MSGSENFLARWSRRKRQAAAPLAAKRASPSGADGAAATDTPTAEAPHPEIPLPPIEAIDAATDLRPFLAPGVPAALARAALRRAWTADPAIRDFVGLAENAWDFTAPDGVPGFGTLTGEEVRRLVAYLAPEPAPAEVPALPAPAASKPEPAPEPAPRNAAVQHEEAEKKTAAPHVIRRHGGALPQ